MGKIRPLLIVFFALLPLTLIGCGKKGPPTAPGGKNEELYPGHYPAPNSD